MQTCLLIILLEGISIETLEGLLIVHFPLTCNIQEYKIDSYNIFVNLNNFKEF